MSWLSQAWGGAGSSLTESTAATQWESMGIFSGDAPPLPTLTYMQARYMSAEGLFIAVTTGAAMGVGYQMINRTEKGPAEQDDLSGAGRSAGGGAVLFGALYVAAPGWLRFNMGFEPIVSGRTAALEAMAKQENLGTGWFS